MLPKFPLEEVRSARNKRIASAALVQMGLVRVYRIMIHEVNHIGTQGQVR